MHTGYSHYGQQPYYPGGQPQMAPSYGQTTPPPYNQMTPPPYGQMTPPYGQMPSQQSSQFAQMQQHVANQHAAQRCGRSFCCMAQCSTAQYYSIGCADRGDAWVPPYKAGWGTSGAQCMRAASYTVHPRQESIKILFGSEGYLIPGWDSIDHGTAHLCTKHYYWIKTLKPLAYLAMAGAAVYLGKKAYDKYQKQTCKPGEVFQNGTCVDVKKQPEQSFGSSPTGLTYPDRTIKCRICHKVAKGEASIRKIFPTPEMKKKRLCENCFNKFQKGLSEAGRVYANKNGATHLKTDIKLCRDKLKLHQELNHLSSAEVEACRTTVLANKLQVKKKGRVQLQPYTGHTVDHGTRFNLPSSPPNTCKPGEVLHNGRCVNVKEQGAGSSVTGITYSPPASSERRLSPKEKEGIYRTFAPKSKKEIKAEIEKQTLLTRAPASSVTQENAIVKINMLQQILKGKEVAQQYTQVQAREHKARVKRQAERPRHNTSARGKKSSKR